MNSRLIAAVALGSLALFAGDAIAEDYVVVQVAEVRVTAQRPGSAGSWDGVAVSDGGGLCSLLKAGGSLIAGAYFSPAAAPLGGAVAGFLCSSGAKQQQRDPRAPDLLLRLNGDGVAPFYSDIAPDAYFHDFGYQVVVPLSAIPELGLKLTVFDQDGAGPDDGELIGSFRLSSEDLTRKPGANAVLRTLSDGAVTKLELIIRAAPELPKRGALKHSVARAPVGTGVHLLAGDLLTISATGRYNVTSFSSAPNVGPEGLAGNDARLHNIRGLPGIPHASALAFVGGTALPSGACGKFVVPSSGELFVGVNDKDTTNNEGELRFSWSVQRAAPEAWRSAGAALPCSAAVSSAEVSCAAAATKMTDLYIAGLSGDGRAKATNARTSSIDTYAAVCERRAITQAQRRCIISASNYAAAQQCR